MENFVVDFQSKTNSLLLNPRLPSETRNQVLSVWKKVDSQFDSHVGLLTSGSSGSAKLVLLSKQALLAAAEGANQHLTSGRSDTWLKTLPEFHVGGLSIYARASLSGARIVSAGDWETEEVYNLAVREKATLISLVPTQLYDLVSKKLPSPPTLRAAITGGGALSPELYRSARALSWPVLPSYGLTECGSQVATAEVDQLPKNNSALTLLPHIEAKSSESGRLKIRSAALLTAYVNLKNAEVTDPKTDGWFETEDVAQVSGRQLIVKGREQDFLKIGGESVDLAALEKTFDSVWKNLDSTGDAALLPIPDERLGAFIVLLAAQVGENQLKSAIEAYNAKVMPYERIRAAKLVDNIPRSELGKLLRSIAINMYLGYPFPSHEER